MNHQFIEARELIAKAREALRGGDKTSARHLGEEAARRAPEMEDAWLILAASDSNPEQALAHAQKALALNPQSDRARRALEWAAGRLQQARAADPTPASAPVAPEQAAATAHSGKTAPQRAAAPTPAKSGRRNWLPGILLGAAGCLLAGFVLLFALTSPVVASIVGSVAAPTQEPNWAQVEIAKPGVTPVDGSALGVQLVDTPTSIPPTTPATTAPQFSASASPAPSDVPTQIPTEVPTQIPAASPTAAATETPGTLAMEMVADTPTSEYVAPTYAAPTEQIASGGDGVRWIDVDLTNQMVYAYEGDTVVNSFVVSTGTAFTPTVTGTFKIYIRLLSGDMRGPGYYLPDVPYIMYFYKSYGLHGTYWHHNFGTPMSHGCVNLSIADAAWLYNWSHLGTEVNVHY